MERNIAYKDIEGTTSNAGISITYDDHIGEKHTFEMIDRPSGVTRTECTLRPYLGVGQYKSSANWTLKRRGSGCTVRRYQEQQIEWLALKRS